MGQSGVVTTRRVVGPSGPRAIRYWAQMLRDPLTGYGALSRRYGDAVRIPLTRSRAFYLLARPEHAEHVLVQHQDRYTKAFTYRPLRAFLGDGLLTSEGPTWQRHRRLVQPILSHRHIQCFAPAIVAAARQRTAGWTPGMTIDIAAEMRTFTMDVIGRILFGTNLAEEAEHVGRAVSRLQGVVIAATLLPLGSPERARAVFTKLPRIGSAAATLDSLVSRIIDDRTAHPHRQPTDLLDMLLAAGSGEQPLTRQEIHDEVMTLVLAGHETTANTLTWALTLLSRYPSARDRLATEIGEVCGTRDAGIGDFDSLHWTQAVLSEAMRLYPPAWTIERDALTNDTVAGVEVAAGDTVAISPYLLHRNREFWSNPEGFDPTRFLPDNAMDRPRYAYLPFGGGRRICVGAGLAQLESTLALATFTQTALLDLLPTATVRARADVTLHPRGPVLATVTAPTRGPDGALAVDGAAPETPTP